MSEPSASPGAGARRRHWSERLADDAQRRWEAAGASGPIVCASGISPSGPIHVGNLREVFTTHLVVEALRGRGLPARHLHSWDDYDRLRKVPAGVDASFGEWVGRPLSSVPDPFGSAASWADRFIDEFVASLDALGIVVDGVRQSERYVAGVYNASIRRALDARFVIFDLLEAVRTPGRAETPVEERRAAYYPFVPYCESCGRDTTGVSAWDAAASVVSYFCRGCGSDGSMSLADGERISGKLVWKADWPMRWAWEGVVFEPAGEDHHAPAGSFTVGRGIVSDVFGGEAPLSAVYSFVGLSGVGGKMSGSGGGAVTPAFTLRYLEPVIVRWPYVARQLNQGFTVDMSPKGIQKLYDHWDRFAASAADESLGLDEAGVYRASSSTSAGEVSRTPNPVSFRLLASVADLTQGNREQMSRILGAHLGAPSGLDLDALEPRLSCAIRYATELIPEAERTVVRSSFDAVTFDALDPATQEGIALLRSSLRAHWTLDGLTSLVYSVPKLQAGLEADAPPTPELKKSQREFFKAVYRLLCGAETGPRIPTLLLSIGADTAEALLGGSSPVPDATTTATIGRPLPT